MGMKSRGLNEFQNEVMEYTGLSIPRFAHLRNLARCCDCGKWFRASKYLPKDLIQDNKDADGFGVDIHPGIMCGKCGRKYWTRADEKSPLDFFNGKVLDFRKISKRRLKIRNSRKMMEKDDG